jgi:hypothetical protein
MVNLRYHIVSIVAVFLALAIGVVMGSTVIDRGIVDVLNGRVRRVENSLKTMRDDNRHQSDQLRVWSGFADQARNQLLVGRLKDVPVLLVGVTGIDRGPVEDLRQQLVVAGARLEGTLWLARKLRLDDDASTRALAGAIDVAPDHADVVRRALVARVAANLTTGPGSTPSVLNPLRDNGFVDFEPPPGAPADSGRDLSSLLLPGTRTVLVSGAGAQVADDQLAIPLAQTMAEQGAAPVAAESGQDTRGGRSVFVGLLRNNSDVSGRITTVDNLESLVGQVAVVLAIGELGAPRYGHFGVGPDAQRLLPQSPS